MYRFPLLRSGLGFAFSVGLYAAASVASDRAIAADQVVFQYQALRESFSIQELTSFAATGKASATLERYLKLSPNGSKEFRQALTNKVSVNRSQVDQFLNSWVGKLTLDEVSQIIRNSSGQANKQALRSAIVRSTEKDNTFSLLEVFQNYPTAQVEVDVYRLIQTSNRINSPS